MAYDADILVDRRRLKRRLLLWRGLAILAVVALVAAAVGRFAGFAGGTYIARVSIDGIIVNDQHRLDLLDRLSRDASVRAVILRIDSPGGTVVGGEALFEALGRVGEKKPVVAVMNQVGTSAAYMIALASDRIFVREGTITGSIGVILQATEITGLLEKLGITSQSIKSGPLKAVPNPLEPITPEARRVTQRLVDDLFDMFVDMVVSRRALSKDDVRKLADGRVFTGRMAVKNGLVDQIGGEREARDWLAAERDIDKTVRIRDVRARRPVDAWVDRLDGLARKTVFSERLTLDGLVSVWHPALQ